MLKLLRNFDILNNNILYFIDSQIYEDDETRGEDHDTGSRLLTSQSKKESKRRAKAGMEYLAR